MATLSITKTYRDGEVLFESDLDNIKNDLETFLNTTKINDDNIQESGIDGGSKLIDNTITSSEITAETLSTSNIAASAVTTAKIADSNVTTAKINDSAISTAKIADSNVTTAKINDGAVTTVKKGTVNYGLSSSCGTFATTSGTYVDITNLEVTITTNGKPLLISIVPDGSSSAYMTTSGTNSSNHYLKLLVDGSFLSEADKISIRTATRQASVFQTYQPINAGTYTFKLQAKTDGGVSFGINNYKLLVCEIF